MRCLQTVRNVALARSGRISRRSEEFPLSQEFLEQLRQHRIDCRPCSVRDSGSREATSWLQRHQRDEGLGTAGMDVRFLAHELLNTPTECNSSARVVKLLERRRRHDAALAAKSLEMRFDEAGVAANRSVNVAGGSQDRRQDVPVREIVRHEARVGLPVTRWRRCTTRGPGQPNPASISSGANTLSRRSLSKSSSYACSISAAATA